MRGPDVFAKFLYRGGAEIAHNQPRILFIAAPSWLPALGTSGSPMIAHALTKAFAARGWSVGFHGLVKPDRWPGATEAEDRIQSTGAGSLSRFWFSPRTRTNSDAHDVAATIADMDPEIIFCYGAEAAAHARLANPRGRIVVTFYDPLHLPGLYKRIVRFRHGSLRAKLSVLRSLPATVKRWFEDRRSMTSGLAAADIIICHSYNHSRDYADKLRRPVEYFPNPLELTPCIARADALRPPAFLMAGNVSTTVSLTGFYFFCDRVLPHIQKDLARGDFQIRVVGGGRLPEELRYKLTRHDNVYLLGHVSDDQLHDEYARAAALLVPTPTPVGFRTRIVDAFRFGVPTIVHAANKAGFHELESGRNCLMTTDGGQFAEYMREAVVNPNRLRSIAETARREFEQSYSADAFYNFVANRIASLNRGSTQ